MVHIEDEASVIRVQIGDSTHTLFQSSLLAVAEHQDAIFEGLDDVIANLDGQCGLARASGTKEQNELATQYSWHCSTNHLSSIGVNLGFPESIGVVERKQSSGVVHEVIIRCKHSTFVIFT